MAYLKILQITPQNTESLSPYKTFPEEYIPLISRVFSPYCHLTGVKKESFYWCTKTIAHNKGFPRKYKQIRHVGKVYSVKTKSTVSFSSLM